MADDQTKEALGTAAAWLGGTGALAGLGVFLRGFWSGATGQEKEVREALAARVERLEAKVEALEQRLEARTKGRDHWRQLCREARWEAEKLGFDKATWPPEPLEET